MFRGRIGELLPWLRLKHKDWEVGFRLEQAEREAAALPETPVEQMPATPEETSKFEQIAELSPRAAILDLRAELEAAVKSFAEGVGLTGGATNLWSLTRALRKNKLIDSQTSALLDDLRGIGNAAMHGSDSAFTKEDAMRFRALAERMIWQLSVATGAARLNMRPAPLPDRMD
jgi:hypothetical protein